ncbi:extracellular calcium-sensing receptor-like [Protopterus annectens]|uniref:extracellular calcium-sensing receptor-like n=1 Tax=Protopterus annectens TaxID=7888 RepID=UPI001CFACFCA|nr:extracellular calcium-sensing receptor-like [Protopterus annectens]
MQFPSFLRTVPNYLFPNSGVAKLLWYFGWKWVVIITIDNETGEFGGQHLKMEILRLGACVELMERVHAQHSNERLLKTVELVKKSTANVILINSDEIHAKAFLEALYLHNVTGRVLLFTAAFTITPGLLSNEARIIMNNTLGLIPFSGTMAGFKDFLQGLNPSTSTADIFIKPYWEKVFACKWQANTSFASTTPHEMNNEKVVCTGMEMIDETIIDYFELNDLSYTYHAYLAVYGYASSLGNIMLCQSRNESFTYGCRSKIKRIQPWQV